MLRQTAARYIAYRALGDDLVQAAVHVGGVVRVGASQSDVVEAGRRANL